MVLVKIPLILGLASRSFLALTAGNCQMTSETPNNSFKPNLLRYTKAMAEKACHGFGSTTQVGLTQALGLKGTITYRSEEHTSELQSLMRISYAVFCLKKKKKT